MKLELVEALKDFLEKKGYELFEYLRGCFDLAAKRERLLLLKILGNVDSFQPSQAKDLKILSKSLSASPFLIGERTRREQLEEDVLYERFGLPTLHPETFKSAVEGEYPYKLRTKGGMFGRINSKRLKELRKEREMTQKELADRLGVSQKNVSEHERGCERAEYSVVKLAESELSKGVKGEINPFEIDLEEVKQERVKGGLKSLLEYFERTGFETNYTSRAPPEIIAKESATLLSRFGRNKKMVSKFESSLRSFSKLSESSAFLITEEDYKSKRLPVFSREELDRIEDSKELIKMVRERKK